MAAREDLKMAIFPVTITNSIGLVFETSIKAKSLTHACNLLNRIEQIEVFTFK